MSLGDYYEICEIIYFLNKGESYFKASYDIMVECFLQVIVRNKTH